MGKSMEKEVNAFKKEWSEGDFKKVKQALKRFFLFKGLQIRSCIKVCYTYADLDSLLGLPYTSSSDYAGVWVTNEEVKSNDHPGYNYIGFAIGEDNKVYAILWDSEENEILQAI